MARISKERLARAAILDKLPPDAVRVLVVDNMGAKKYRDFASLADDDVIQLKKDGDPIVMRAKPGRQTPVGVGPANKTVKEVLKRKKKAMDKDPVYRTITSSPDSPNVLHEVIKGLGEETASLKFEREEAARLGQGTANFSTKRVAALKATADIWLKRMDQIGGKAIDLDSPVYLALFSHTLSTLKASMEAARLRPEEVEVVFTRFATMVSEDEWKEEALLLMKKAIGG